MKNILAKAVAALVILASSVYANASIITLNGSQEVNALKINESFESFYNFTNWSANTGFEKANELVAFFVDDPGDRDPVVSTATGTNVKFTYVAGKTDGLVFSNFLGDFWGLDIVFGSFSGIDGYSFLSFDGNGQATTVLSGTGLDDISILSVPGSNVTQVSAPSTILMFALVLMGMATVRRR
ncbi:PEP-CTERM sorting domain-containing protein [Alteromonadaceae bacterium A_SAG1]|nr:PEP-CTERM sorting domain-containing protein [Alteromonadaceae bacterium A_SAG1]